VVEATFHLPRPAIIYVTNPRHADSLCATLRASGFGRVASYTGETNPNARTEVEEGWRDSGARATRYDVVVATSAFGLGIDQADVRSVIHAYTPETASRFYQEVGRGGRDGRACLSILFSARRDIRQCRKLATAVYPGPMVRPRWDSMFLNRVAIANDERSWIDLDDVRPGLRAKGVLPGNRKNRAWNQRVLTLLQDAGLIILDTPVAAVPPAEFRSPIGMRLVRGDTLEQPTSRPCNRSSGQVTASPRSSLRDSLSDLTTSIEYPHSCARAAPGVEVTRDFHARNEPGLLQVRTCRFQSRSAHSPPRFAWPRTAS
jgi:hypothetical protein